MKDIALAGRHYSNDWLSCKQKCNNFGYPLNEVQSKGNDKWIDTGKKYYR